MDFVLGLLWQRELMEPAGGSGQEGFLGQVVTMAPGTTALAAPIRTPSTIVDPAENSPGIPWQELDTAHSGQNAHRVQRAEPSDEVADPEATMVELEQEHRDQENDLLAQISDLDNKAWSYEEHLNELASANVGLHEALHN
jgi:hypothetical protein